VSDTRHFMTYDADTKTFKAWWFNDSSVGAMELEGTVEGDKLVLLSKPTNTGGRHRSVAIAGRLQSSLTALGYSVSLKHRDLLKS